MKKSMTHQITNKKNKNTTTSKEKQKDHWLDRT